MPKLVNTPKASEPSETTVPKPEYRKLTLKSCEDIIKAEHYSKRLPAGVKLCYGLVTYSPERRTEACVVYSQATGRWEADNLWELTRLVRLPDFDDPMTRLISKSIGYIRQYKLAELIVSFADATQDHHGGIYQSCSWLYDGMRDQRLDGFEIDGVFMPARTCNIKYGTSSEVELPKHPKLVKRSVVPHFDGGKHCYWKPLTKTGMSLAKSLGLRSVSYPKPMLLNEEVYNYGSTTRPDLHKGKRKID